MHANQKPPSDIQDRLRMALGHQQRGQLALAEELYRAVLEAEPDNFDALHLYGVLKHQAGEPLEALKLIGEALRRNGQAAAAHSNRASALIALGRHQDALESCDRALALRPDFPEALVNRGNALAGLARREDAIASYEKALALRPNDLQARINCTACLRLLGRSPDALHHYDAALALAPDRLDLLVARGNVLHELRRFDDALASFQRALAIKPDFPEIVSNCGNALMELRRFEEALVAYDRALALKPDYAEGHNNRGNVLLALNRPAEARAAIEQALVRKPDYLEARINRGNALRDLSGPRDAIDAYDAALAIDAQSAEAHWNKALAQLALGDFARGWENYEWRWRRAGAAARTFSVSQWRGEALAGKTILLHAEQGFGDTIQFIRYAPLVARLGARIVLEIPDALRPLLDGLPGIAAVIARGDTTPPIDLHCPLMSLPLAFRTTIDSIPGSVPYLQVPAAYRAKWAQRLPHQQRSRVGLAWSGNPTHRDDHNRSIALARFAPLFEAAGAEFVSLQRDIRDTDRAALQALPILALGEQFADFADAAAAIECLDLVIAADTSIAHLAGALGKPVWILLPLVPDWRWLLDRSDSPWYPTARLFRQPVAGDWTSVIARLRSEIVNLVHRARG